MIVIYLKKYWRHVAIGLSVIALIWIAFSVIGGVREWAKERADLKYQSEIQKLQAEQKEAAILNGNLQGQVEQLSKQLVSISDELEKAKVREGQARAKSSEAIRNYERVRKERAGFQTTDPSAELKALASELYP